MRRATYAAPPSTAPTTPDRSRPADSISAAFMLPRSQVAVLYVICAKIAADDVVTIPQMACVVSDGAPRNVQHCTEPSASYRNCFDPPGTEYDVPITVP